MLSSHTHTHTDTHTCYKHSLPPLSFLRFQSFLGLSLRLFRLFLRLVSLPQSRAKYPPFFYSYLSLALLALLFLCFFLLFLRLFRYLFRFTARAPQSGTVCVSNPVPKGSEKTNVRVSHSVSKCFLVLFQQGAHGSVPGVSQRSSRFRLGYRKRTLFRRTCQQLLPTLSTPLV